MRVLFIDDCIDHGQVGNTEGYGTAYILTELGTVRRGAHRVVFYMFYGYWPEAVMHTCDNPRCVNIRHLVGGTRDMNNKDRAAKGRSARVQPLRRKLTDQQAAEIRQRYNPRRDKDNGVVALSRDFGVDVNAIYQIVQGRTYR
ncbi:hypothetical protein DDP54_15685 (plasmid) [Cellulomonas sp. WB94]|uniref:HNH endonuclease signature motif containing protein n=1 Tax=Cellulomonas sp. WB94 TaxID=2173174 RepID=UPI000D56BFC1|nr:HNH endonuclease signature motif containing protein [Cellulomonas sp. WB94]PVU81341.1 hypothetical protein DDP54_15685 [Cellulomonas sp. WB94]